MPIKKINIFSPIEVLTNKNPKLSQKIKKLGINTIKDLLWYFPFRYEDFSQIYKINQVKLNQEATICGKIKSVKIRKSWHRKIFLVEAIIEDDTGKIKAVWFNQPFLKNILETGRLANFSGKIALNEKKEIYLSHPVYEFIDLPNQVTKHTGRLVPIYSEIKGLSSKILRNLIEKALRMVLPIKEWIPNYILFKYDLFEINSALQKIHFPQKLNEALNAKKRFIFDDLFLLQLYNLKQKLNLLEQKAPQINFEIDWIKNILKSLPFELTLAQKKALWEILKDLTRIKPMNRLLQGDVGSGKTIVAALASLVVAKNDLQTVFMAPTEVLANQHFETFKKIFKYINLENQPVLGLLTSSSAKIFYENDLESNILKNKIYKSILNNEIKIIIGTHALIQKSVKFSNLGFVIIDEQHRFGVRQRAELLKNGDLIPHFLSMSATPIPRTLMHTIFGDLDVSIINELPKGRKPIITRIVPKEKRNDAYKFIHKEILSGRQVFVICPRIENKTEEDNEANQKLSRRQILNLELKNVKSEYEKLQNEIFPDLKVAMLHGKMKPKEKDEIMNKFKNKEIDILVSTSVIEVGVDVPNASIMVIEGAERFGLAQLYQFRGRVGRGEHQSYCFLFVNSDNLDSLKRLRALILAKNGFELAEMDLKLRGPGEFLGEAQSGFSDLAIKGLSNPEIVKISRESALDLIKKDPFLKNHPLVLEKLEDFSKKIHLE
jgi:ATP-dependent DNA helicase RecG